MLFHFLIKCNLYSVDLTILKFTQEWWIKSIKTIALIHDSGGYREEETPSPISNLEAKLFIADNTLSYWDGNVGRCQFSWFYPTPLLRLHLADYFPYPFNIQNYFIDLVNFFIFCLSNFLF